MPRSFLPGIWQVTDCPLQYATGQMSLLIHIRICSLNHVLSPTRHIYFHSFKLGIVRSTVACFIEATSILDIWFSFVLLSLRLAALLTNILLECLLTILRRISQHLYPQVSPRCRWKSVNQQTKRKKKVTHTASIRDSYFMCSKFFFFYQNHNYHRVKLRLCIRWWSILSLRPVV